MDAESNSLPASLVLRTPIHSERLQYGGRVFSVIIVQDDNPRLEWTREGERGTRKTRFIIRQTDLPKSPALGASIYIYNFLTGNFE